MVIGVPGGLFQVCTCIYIVHSNVLMYTAQYWLRSFTTSDPVMVDTRIENELNLFDWCSVCIVNCVLHSTPSTGQYYVRSVHC